MIEVKLPSGASDFYVSLDLSDAADREKFASICEHNAGSKSPLYDKLDRAFYRAKAAELRSA